MKRHQEESRETVLERDRTIGVPVVERPSGEIDMGLSALRLYECLLTKIRQEADPLHRRLSQVPVVGLRGVSERESRGRLIGNREYSGEKRK